MRDQQNLVHNSINQLNTGNHVAIITTHTKQEPEVVADFRAIHNRASVGAPKLRRLVEEPTVHAQRCEFVGIKLAKNSNLLTSFEYAQHVSSAF